MALCAALLWMAPAEADAQQRPGEGTVRLSLDSQIVGLGLYPDAVTAFGLGVAGRGLGPGFGYGITDDILIGARTALGMTYYDPNSPGDTLSGSVALLPYFEIVFGSEGLVPFVGAQAGFGLFFPDGGDVIGSFTGGAYGGLHVMLTESFSFSPFVELNFVYGNTNDVLLFGLGLTNERGGFSMALGFSLQGWIGDVQEAVSDATDDGFDTSGTDDGIFNREGSGGDAGGGDGGGGGGAGDNVDNTQEPDPEGGLE